LVVQRFPEALRCFPRSPEGEGVETDKRLSTHSLKLSGDQVDARGQRFYGWMLFMGDGVEPDKQIAVHYCKISADHGDALTNAVVA
jgi:TPR repeat protein